ncbi:MAG: NosD domain-containing protein [Candidatus Hodarchaeota archaeon]
MITLKIIHFRLAIAIFLLLYPAGLYTDFSEKINEENILSSYISDNPDINPDLSIRYDEHDPIRIVGTPNFRILAESENWQGDGSQKNPYLIDGLNITNFGNLISIHNTDLHFQIINCHLTGREGYGRGIFFSNVSNSYISNNVINSIGGVGILIDLSSNIVITENIIQNNNREGIWIGESNLIDISSNSVFNNRFIGIDLYRSEENNVTRNDIFNNGIFGIKLLFSSNNHIFSNSFSNNADYGVWMENSNNNNVVWNFFVDNKLGGSSQAYDDGIGNSFTDNYWSEWIHPDIDEDGIVDYPYYIDGLSNNQDAFPHVSNLQTQSIINNWLQRPNTVFGAILLAIILSLLGVVIIKQRK